MGAMGSRLRPGDTALVTGASSGIGTAFAEALAARGLNLVLVSRDVARLESVAQRLRGDHGVAVEVLAADLADPVAVSGVAERLRDGDRAVDVLVCNAGLTLRGHFASRELDDELGLLDVLVRSVLVLTHAALPGMLRRGRGHLVTVSSVAGFLPTGTYSAAKSWLTAFTRGVHSQTTGTGVGATVVCPGFVRTEFHERAGMKASAIPRFAWLSSAAVVAHCLVDVEAGRVVSIPSRRYRFAVVILRLAPIRAVDALLGRRSARRRRRRSTAGASPA